jgi:hypothetical protein
LIRCIEREFEQLNGKGEVSASIGMVDEKVPDCWYDGNTSESETEGNNEVSQNRLARVANTESAKPKRRRNTQSTGGQAVTRKVSLKMPENAAEGLQSDLNVDIEKEEKPEETNFPKEEESPVEDTIMSSNI